MTDPVITKNICSTNLTYMRGLREKRLPYEPSSIYICGCEYTLPTTSSIVEAKRKI